VQRPLIERAYGCTCGHLAISCPLVLSPTLSAGEWVNGAFAGDGSKSADAFPPTPFPESQCCIALNVKLLDITRETHTLSCAYRFLDSVRPKLDRKIKNLQLKNKE